MIYLHFHFCYIVFPDIKKKLLEAARKNAMQKATPDTRNKLKRAWKYFPKIFLVGLIAATLMGYLYFWGLGSLIGAAIAKKESEPIVD